MPEIKNLFTQGKMNKDLDERLIANGQYRDAMNVQVSTSEDSDVGTVQNILGNKRVEGIVGSGYKCIGSIADEKSDKVYWFIHSNSVDAIIEYHKDGAVNPILIDTKVGTTEAVLNFPESIITGINIIENLIFWTDNNSEPKKININRCKQGTKLDSSGNMTMHTRLIVDGIVATKDPISVIADGQEQVSTTTLNLDDTSNLGLGFILISQAGYDVLALDITIQNITGNTVTLSSSRTWGDNDVFIFGEIIDIEEEHITIIKKKPTKAPTFKIITTEDETVDLLFEKALPRFSCRYKYEDGEYSAFGPFTDIVFKSNYLGEYGMDNAFTQKDTYNTGMVNIIKEIELTDFIAPDMPKDVIQVDILYKQENSNVVFSIDTIKKADEDSSGNLVWELSGSNQDTSYNSKYKGYYKVETENIYAAVPANQLLRPWDNVPRKALAQEVTGNRIVYGNYLQGYDFGTGPDGKLIRPDVNADYGTRLGNIGSYDFSYGGVPSIKSLRNYQLGIVFGDKYGRETPVFTSSEGAFQIGWLDKNSNLSASQHYQLQASSASYFPDWADYYKIFIKETSGEYYNLVMDRAYTANRVSEELGEEDHIWISFNSSDRSKINEEDYIILKKQIGAGVGQINEDNKYKVLDIKNEAPNAVKFVLINIGTVANAPISISTSATPINNETILNNDGGWGGQASPEGIFTDPIYRPTNGRDTLKLRKDNWLINDGMQLDNSAVNNEELYFSFYRTDTSEYSKRYRVSTVNWDDPFYTIKLKNSITETFAGVENTPGDGLTYFLDANLVVKFERKAARPIDSLSGKFFVKIVSNALTSTTIEASIGAETVTQYLNQATAATYWLADVYNTADSDAADGIINATAPSSSPTGTDAANSIASGHSGSNTTASESDWHALIDSRKWFVDSMYFAAVQPNDTLDVNASGVLMWGGGSKIPTAPGYNNWFTYWPDNPGLNGANLQNGMEAFVKTVVGGPHTSPGGNRRWRTDKRLTTLDDTYGSENSGGKFFLHLSFGKCGKDLVDNTSFPTLGDIHPHYNPSYNQSFSWNFQKIHSGTSYYSGSNWGANYHYGQNYFWSGMSSGSNASLYNIYSINSGFISPHQGYHDQSDPDFLRQWDPTYGGTSVENNANEKVVNAIHNKKSFKFTGDPTNTVYKIKSYKIKRLYNHTTWRTTYQWDGTTSIPSSPPAGSTPSTLGLVRLADSVEARAQLWRESYNSNLYSNNSVDSTVFDNVLEQQMLDTLHNFGKANNRRVCYILELNIDPTDPADNGGYNPLDWSAGSNTPNQPDANTSVGIEFVDIDINVVGAIEVKNPSIWETEPKESTDLDIYYEASQAIPIDIKEENRELFAPVGSIIEFLDNPEAKDGGFTTSNDIYLAAWSTSGGDNELYLSEEINSKDGPGNDIAYEGKRVRFHRKDGSYTTAKILSMVNNSLYNQETYSYDSVKIVQEIDPSAEIGLSWYNCLSFGNGLESDRIRDDFNAMTITSGVKASTTIEEPYQEERRKSGLIYSGLYNSTSGINNLNQFIMAEKITKDLNPTYGSIQKLFTRRISLIAFCEDRVIGITANKDALYNADGSPQLISSNAVLGDANPFAGDYGISKNPESFAKESYRAYFADKQRGTVLRLSMDGLTPISDAGMRDYFRDNLKIAGKLIGSYDEYKKDYNISLSNYLPENILINSTVDQGDMLTEYFLPDDHISNGNFNDATNYTVPAFPSNGLLNSGFDVETLITNHYQIPPGYFQPEVLYQPPNPAIGVTGTPPTFSTTEVNIYEWANSLATSSTHHLIGGSNPAGLAGGSGVGVNWEDEDGSSNNIYSYGSSGTYFSGLYYYQVVSTDYAFAKLQDTPTTTFTHPTTNQIYAIGYNVPTTVNAHPSNPQSVASLFSAARDNSIFNGEEIMIEFVNQITGSNDEVKIKIELYDGTQPVDATFTHVPTGASTDPGGGTLPFGDVVTSTGTIFTSWQSNTGSNAHQINVGFQSGNSYTFPIRYEYQYNNDNYKIFFKFTDPSAPTEEKIVVNDLRVRVYDVETSSGDTSMFMQFRIKKKYNYSVPGFPEVIVGSIDPEVLAQPPIPSAPIPAWVEVEHTVDNWTSTGTPEHWKLFEPAITAYGPQLPAVAATATASYDQGGYITGDTISWVIPDSSVITTSATPTFNQYGNSIQTTNSWANKHNTATNGHLTQDLTVSGGFGSLIGDNWYELTCTYTGTLTGDVIVSKVLDPATIVGSTPSGHIGTAASSPFHLIMEDDNNGNLKARWKQSTDASSYFDELKILGHSCSAIIDNVELRNISTPPSGGDVTYWGGFSSNMNMRNYYAYKNVYQDAGKVHWVNGGGMRTEPDGDGVQVNNSLTQVFGTYNDTASTLPPSEDGYALSFTISNYINGELEGYVHGAGVDDGSGGYIASGFDFSGINTNGDWVVKGNTDGTAISMTVDDGSGILTSGSVVGNPNITTQGHMNKTVFSAKTTSANSVGALNASISNITLKDITNYFSGGNAGNWVIEGFDKTIEEYIVWNTINQYIEFNAAPEEALVDGVLTSLTVKQNINRNFYEGETYNFRFDLTGYIGPGAIRGYFYNHLGKGFTFGPIGETILDDAGNQIYFNGTPSYYFNETVVIGDDNSAVTDNNLLRNTLVFIIDSGPFTANLDNIILQQEFPEFIPKTITYSEDVKGWVSFKSFIPESGLSVSSNYYTFRNGGLYQHHINDIRNKFYDSDPVESTVTSVLNGEPSVVKMFNTLNYEGSQSKIDAFVTDISTSATNAGIYNLNEKDGWYVSYIKTDKQEGSLNEFIEKEGKWFNYIKGVNNNIDTASFSFQGLGVAASIDPQTV